MISGLNEQLQQELEYTLYIDIYIYIQYMIVTAGEF